MKKKSILKPSIASCAIRQLDLAKNFVEITGDYFVHDTIIEFDEFDEQLKAAQRSKPFYILPQDELLKKI